MLPGNAFYLWKKISKFRCWSTRYANVVHSRAAFKECASRPEGYPKYLGMQLGV